MKKCEGASAIARLFLASNVADARIDAEDETIPSRAEWLCRRPSLPPVFFLAIALWIGVAVAIDSLFGTSPSRCWNLGVLAVILTGASFVVLMRFHALVGCLLVGMSLGCAIGSFHALAMVSGGEALVGHDGETTIRLIHDSRSGAFGRSAVGATRGGSLVRLHLNDDARLMVGDYVIASSFKKPQERNARTYWRDGIVATASAHAAPPSSTGSPVSMLRAVRRDAVESTMQCGKGLGSALGLSLDDGVLLLRAMAMGYTDDLYSSSLYQSVKVDGLAHLVAVSGTHLSLVCGLVAIAVRRMPLPRSGGIAVQAFLIAGYLVFTGAPISAIRAATMTAIGMFSFFSKRRSYALGGLSCCTILIIASDPTAAFSPSLLLSATATAGIVLFCGYFCDTATLALHAPAGILRDSVALTAAASLITGPIAASLYGQVSAVSAIANLVVAPVVPFICGGGTLVAVIDAVFPAAGHWMLGAMLVFLKGVCVLLETISCFPGAAFPLHIDPATACLLAFGVPAALWMAWPRTSLPMVAVLLLATILMICVSISAPFMRGNAITMLDVGQGDAILLQSEGRSLLIDTGTEDVALLEGLASCGVRFLDAVLITHPDDDHCGSLGSLRGIVGVGEVVVAHDLLDESNEHCAKLRRSAKGLVGESGIRGVSLGECIEVGSLRCTVVGPDEFADGGGNADSLVLLMEADVNADGVNDCIGLFCGDAEQPQLAQYVRKGRIGDIDILKVGHHGSRAAVNAPLLDVLKPEISLISVGHYNRYGHPVPETVALLEEGGSKVYRTDEDGMITCFLRSDGMQVHVER